jgi:hypothetical protein
MQNMNMPDDIEGLNHMDNDGVLHEKGTRTPKMYYYEGSMLQIEWTAQHGCGGHGDNPRTHCDVIIQVAFFLFLGELVYMPAVYIILEFLVPSWPPRYTYRCLFYVGVILFPLLRCLRTRNLLFSLLYGKHLRVRSIERYF